MQNSLQAVQTGHPEAESPYEETLDLGNYNPKNQSLTQCPWMGIHHFCEFPSQSQVITSTQAGKEEPALRTPDATNALGEGYQDS